MFTARYDQTVLKKNGYVSSVEGSTQKHKYYFMIFFHFSGHIFTFVTCILIITKLYLFTN